MADENQAPKAAAKKTKPLSLADYKKNRAEIKKGTIVANEADRKLAAAGEITAAELRKRAFAGHAKMLKDIGALGAPPSGFTVYGEEPVVTTAGFSFAGVMSESASLKETADHLLFKDANTGLTGIDMFRDLGTDVTLTGIILATGYTRPRDGDAVAIDATTRAVTDATETYGDNVAKVTITTSGKDSITYA